MLGKHFSEKGKIDMEIKGKIKLIADTYGYDAQSRQCIEEMAELTHAINKFWRNSLNADYSQWKI